MPRHNRRRAQRIRARLQKNTAKVSPPSSDASSLQQNTGTSDTRDAATLPPPAGLELEDELDFTGEEGNDVTEVTAEVESQLQALQARMQASLQEERKDAYRKKMKGHRSRRRVHASKNGEEETGDAASAITEAASKMGGHGKRATKQLNRLMDTVKHTGSWEEAFRQLNLGEDAIERGMRKLKKSNTASAVVGYREMTRSERRKLERKAKKLIDRSKPVSEDIREMLRTGKMPVYGSPPAEQAEGKNESDAEDTKGSDAADNSGDVADTKEKDVVDGEWSDDEG